VERITSRLREWQRSPRATPDEPGFSCSVPKETILDDDHDGSLDPRLYVRSEDRPATTPDLSRLLDDLVRRSGATVDSNLDLHTSFDVCERLTSAGSEPPQVPLGQIVSGSTASTSTGRLLAGPSGSLIRADDYVDFGGVPVVMPKDLADTGFDAASIRSVTERQAEDLDRFRLRVGDVVLARRGELGRCAVVRPEQEGWICGTGCFFLRPPAELDADYFAAYLRSSEARTWLDGHSTGSTTLKTISLDVLVELPVTLPDLRTQQAIAVMMRQLDEHEQLLREQLAVTRKLRQDSVTALFAR
jgi:type I restriction enzyme M protein